MSSDSIAYPARLRARPRPLLRRARWLERAVARPELIGLIAVAAVLNLWALRINGWANTYYAAAVRSMSSSWHDFLYASLDKSGLMTIDKPPLALWIQALSARIFGFHQLSLLVPQALMGVAAVALVYDLTKRRFGRAAGFVSGLALATTPVAVAVARHNNPDELLLLCSVAAAWCALRALEQGSTRWFVLTGVCIGLGFETKMGGALLVVPGIAAAWIWVARHGRVRALRQSLAAAATTIIVSGAWPLLVALTPAGSRPWISGTSDNSILSLILGYNGLGRLTGQTGGPPGAGTGAPTGAPTGASTTFGGPTGPFRLLQNGLGDQAGWLLGFALVVAVALLLRSRLKRSDPRTGWLLVIGGTFATTALAFSFARGIFHPYYVSLLAPFTAALVGAGVGLMRGSPERPIAPFAIAAGAVTELVVLRGLNGALPWASPLLIAVCGGGAGLLVWSRSARFRVALIALALAALLAAPAAWAAETLGHAESGTFPAGGATSSAQTGAPGGFGPPRAFAGPPPAAPTAFGANDSTLARAIDYARSHGGGTIGVTSQSSAAAAILSQHADVAGLGGFSGRESSISVMWLAEQVRAGHLRWVLIDRRPAFGLPGDTRTGSSAAMSAVTKACHAVNTTLYDCGGRASASTRRPGALVHG